MDMYKRIAAGRWTCICIPSYWRGSGYRVQYTIHEGYYRQYARIEAHMEYHYWYLLVQENVCVNVEKKWAPTEYLLYAGYIIDIGIWWSLYRWYHLVLL